MKTLLIRSGTAEAAEVANRAKQMGCYIVMADRGLEVPAFAYSDSCLLADATNPDEMLPAAERFSRKLRKIDGVITISDAALPAAAAVAERLGLWGPLPETVKLLADKLATKQRLLEAGLSVPWFAPVATPQALQRILIERGTDLLIWPADNRSVAMNPIEVKDLDAAFTSARRKSRTQRVIAEEKVTAQQMTAYTVMSAGRTRALLLRSGSDAPDDLCTELQSSVGSVLLRIAVAIGLVDGPLRIDLAVEDANFSIVDVAVQLSFGAAVDQAEKLLDALIQLSVAKSSPTVLPRLCVRRLSPELSVTCDIREQACSRAGGRFKEPSLDRHVV